MSWLVPSPYVGARSVMGGPLKEGESFAWRDSPFILGEQRAVGSISWDEEGDHGLVHYLFVVLHVGSGHGSCADCVR